MARAGSAWLSTPSFIRRATRTRAWRVTARSRSTSVILFETILPPRYHDVPAAQVNVFEAKCSSSRPSRACVARLRHGLTVAGLPFLIVSKDKYGGAGGKSTLFLVVPARSGVWPCRRRRGSRNLRSARAEYQSITGRADRRARGQAAGARLRGANSLSRSPRR